MITRSTPGAVGLLHRQRRLFRGGCRAQLRLAIITPVLRIIPRVHFTGRRVEHPRVKTVLQTVVCGERWLAARSGNSPRATH